MGTGSTNTGRESSRVDIPDSSAETQAAVRAAADGVGGQVPRLVTTGDRFPFGPNQPDGTSIRVRCDWLQFTVPAEHLDQWTVHLVLAHDSELPEDRSGRDFFTDAKQWTTGARIDWGGTYTQREDGTVMARVTLPGSALERFGPDWLWSIRATLREHGARVRRWDTAIDIRGRMTQDVLEGAIGAAEAGNFFGARKRDIRKSGDRDQPMSYTATFGAKGDDSVQVQFYDKGLQTRTETDPMQWVRIEARFYGERAANVWAFYASAKSHKSAMVTCAELVGGTIDFRERAAQTKRNRKERERCERLPFWDWIIERIGSRRVKLGRIAGAMPRIQWLIHGGGLGTLLSLRDESGLSIDTLVRLLEDAGDRARGGPRDPSTRPDLRTEWERFAADRAPVGC